MSKRNKGWPRNQNTGPNGGLSTGPGGGMSTGPGGGTSTGPGGECQPDPEEAYRLVLAAECRLDRHPTSAISLLGPFL